MGDKRAVGVQTDMKTSDIADMIDHYEAIKGTVQSHDSHQSVLVKQLQDSKLEIERLNDIIRGSECNSNSVDQLWTHRQSSANQQSARGGTIASGQEIFIDDNGNRPSEISNKQTTLVTDAGLALGGSQMAMTRKIQELQGREQ